MEEGQPQMVGVTVPRARGSQNPGQLPSVNISALGATDSTAERLSFVGPLGFLALVSFLLLAFMHGTTCLF